jgi:SNF family Na+-dependent transporter
MPLTVMVYYTYVESWSLGYSLFTATGRYWGSAELDSTFNFLAGYQGLATNEYFSGIAWAYVFFIITMALNVYVLSRGVSGGIELVARYALPALFLFAVILVIRVLLLGTPDPAQPEFSVSEGLGFIWNPDFSQISNSAMWLAAAGQIFFTLSLGMGAMITYGSYLRKNSSLIANSTAICVLDTVIALIACMILFPITFSFGMSASAGPGLVFQNIPVALAQMPGSQFLSITFFALLVFAALTSSISLLEVVASYFIDQKGWSRKKATIVKPISSKVRVRIEEGHAKGEIKDFANVKVRRLEAAPTALPAGVLPAGARLRNVATTDLPASSTLKK